VQQQQQQEVQLEFPVEEHYRIHLHEQQDEVQEAQGQE
jgi:hypothetical protein